MRKRQRPFYGRGCGQNDLARGAIMADAKFATLVQDLSDGGVIGGRGQRCLDGNLTDIGEQLSVDENIVSA